MRSSTCVSKPAYKPLSGQNKAATASSAMTPQMMLNQVLLDDFHNLLRLTQIAAALQMLATD